MEKTTANIIAVIFMWVICSVTAFSFLKNAVMEEVPKRSSKAGAIYHEVRLRARLFLGLLLLLWVLFSLVWVLIKWL